MAIHTEFYKKSAWSPRKYYTAQDYPWVIKQVRMYYTVTMQPINITEPSSASECCLTSQFNKSIMYLGCKILAT